jgi:AmmeMemoRadiSam system protein B
VAGSFYPRQPAELAAVVQRCLEAVARHNAEAIARDQLLKAIIVPHAGYVYSGPVAAPAYIGLRGLARQIKRVVLLGPAHTVRLRGIAAPRTDVFDTPLGPLAVDSVAIADLAGLRDVVLDDTPHVREHCLEVQLPFLKTVLGDVSIVPLVVGCAEPPAVARVLDRLWEGDETLIVLSTDLSHGLTYEAAQCRDVETAAAIEALDGSKLTSEDACGSHALAGLLSVAQARNATIKRLDLRNSGDTVGPRDRVVGYGAWQLLEKAG